MAARLCTYRTVGQNKSISEISTDSTHNERSVLSLCGLHARHASSWHVRPLVAIVGKPNSTSQVCHSQTLRFERRHNIELYGGADFFGPFQNSVGRALLPATARVRDRLDDACLSRQVA